MPIGTYMYQQRRKNSNVSDLTILGSFFMGINGLIYFDPNVSHSEIYYNNPACF